MAHQFSTSYLKDSMDVFRYYKKLGERAMAQCPDEALFTTLDAESNSIAIIVKHMAGNMRSRWTDFLTSDGEKPDRNRDTEFESPPKTRTELLEMWERGWKYVFGALEPLSDEDLKRTITIRTEPHPVTQAINRQVAHYSYHVGQIVYLARHLAGDRWQDAHHPEEEVSRVQQAGCRRREVATVRAKFATLCLAGKNENMTALLIVGGVLGVGILLVIHGTVFKTRWGINTAAQVACPSCHKMHGQICIPRNLRQTLGGGFTCGQCGLETDKWNRPISK